MSANLSLNLPHLIIGLMLVSPALLAFAGYRALVRREAGSAQRSTAPSPRPFHA